MEGVDLTPNYANLRRIFTREVDLIVSRTISEASNSKPKTLDEALDSYDGKFILSELSTLMSRLTVLVLSIDSPQAMDEFTDSLSKWNVDLRTRADEIAIEDDEVPEGVQQGGLL